MIKGSSYLHYCICIAFLTYLFLIKVILLLVLDQQLPPDFSNDANKKSYLFKWFRALDSYEKLPAP